MTDRIIISELATLRLSIVEMTDMINAMSIKLNNLIEEDEFITPTQAAKMLNLSRQTIINYIDEIGAAKRNRKYFIKKSDLINWFENNYRRR